MKILIVGDPHGIFPKKSLPKDIDLILITGDLGKADLARKIYLGKNEEDLTEVRKDSSLQKKMWQEIYDSSIKVIRYFSKIAQTYSILGNVGTATDSEIKKEEKKIQIKLPYLRSELKKIKNFCLVRNGIRNINGVRIGFLDYFLDTCWVREFYRENKKMMRGAKKETEKAKNILKWFNKNKIDILLCHQPPYGVLDKVSGKSAPEHWKGKHAGSKVILEYVKKHKPKYVFCGHIHEGKGKKKLGKTNIINAGCCGDFVVVDVKA